MANRYVAVNNSTGRFMEVEATVVSAGAGDAGKLVALDSAGRIDESVLPVGIGADLTTATASENLSAGDWVNLYDNSSVFSTRKADNTNGRECHGFVLSAVTSGNPASVYRSGSNTGVSGLTAGSRYFLGTSGAETTSLVAAGSGYLLQFLGIPETATAVYFTYTPAVER